MGALRGNFWNADFKQMPFRTTGMGREGCITLKCDWNSSFYLTKVVIHSIRTVRSRVEQTGQCDAISPPLSSKLIPADVKTDVKSRKWFETMRPSNQKLSMTLVCPKTTNRSLRDFLGRMKAGQIRTGEKHRWYEFQTRCQRQVELSFKPSWAFELYGQ